jgi:hypothetical protein
MSKVQPPPLVYPATAGFCPLHPHNNAVGVCRRCQQSFCDVCEIRWNKEMLCLACFTQLVERKEATPGDLQTQSREAALSLGLAIVGWLLFVGSFWMFWSINDGRAERGTAIVNVVLFLVSFIPPLMSLGLASATLRTRGQGLKAATWGLVLAALQIGVTLSLVAVNITHN